MIDLLDGQDPLLFVRDNKDLFRKGKVVYHSLPANSDGGAFKIIEYNGEAYYITEKWEHGKYDDKCIITGVWKMVVVAPLVI